MGTPPRNIPDDLRDGFTMNNTIPVFDYWLNDSGFMTRWTKAGVEELMNKLTETNIRTYNHAIDIYPNACQHILEGLNLVPDIQSKHVAVIGSWTPWIECICLHKKVASVTTVEYNPPQCEDERIKVISYDDFVRSEFKYDVVISYSSIEHSGLGRYGETLDPNGDLETMAQIKKHLCHDGVVLLAVPIGPDYLAWNAHRIYGQKRLPLLVRGYTIMKWIGGDMGLMYRRQEAVLTKEPFHEQPLLVLYPLMDE